MGEMESRQDFLDTVEVLAPSAFKEKPLKEIDVKKIVARPVDEVISAINLAAELKMLQSKAPVDNIIVSKAIEGKNNLSKSSCSHKIFQKH